MKVLIKFLIIVGLIYSCSKSQNNSSATSLGKTTGSTGNTDGGGGGASEAYCTGTSDDGTPDDLNGDVPQSQLFSFQMALANQFTSPENSWKPGKIPLNNSSFAQFGNLSLSDAYHFFKNDGPYYIRLKIKPQFNPNPSEKYCFDRKINTNMPNNKYSKVRYTIYAYKVIKSGSNYTLDEQSKTWVKDVDAVNVSECSGIVKIPQLPSAAGEESATVFEIARIKTDLMCKEAKGTQNESYYCPVEYKAPGTVCVEATIQVSTNNTHFFKGFKRSDF